jgi:DNA-binding MarR family transcriptional regulator
MAPEPLEERRTDPLADQAARAILEGVSLLERRMRQRPVPGELTPPESAALARLGREAPVSAADLARAEDIRPQSMGALVRSLEARGLVKRTRDRTDGRRVLLSLTKAARELTERPPSGRVDQLARALSTGFTDAELEQLVAVAPLLRRLAGTLS